MFKENKIIHLKITNITAQQQPQVKAGMTPEEFKKIFGKGPVKGADVKAAAGKSAMLAAAAAAKKPKPQPTTVPAAPTRTEDQVPVKTDLGIDVTEPKVLTPEEAAAVEGRKILKEPEIAAPPLPTEPTPLPPTPTEEEPLTTLGVTDKTTTAFGIPFDQLTDRQKEIELGFKVARQRPEFDIYSDEELAFLIGQQIPEEIPIEEPGKVAEDIIGRREEELLTKEEQLAKRREELVTGEEERLMAEFEREKGLIEEAGQKRREAAQAGFSFSGFGRSTANVEAQDLIQRDVNEQIRIADLRRKQEIDMYRAGLEGADEVTLQGMRDQIDALKLQEDTMAVETAYKTAELNKNNKVSGLDAINNMLQILPPTTVSQIDTELTSLINDGYLYKTGANGVPEKVLDAEGNAIQTGVDDSAQSSLSFTAPKYDMFGNMTSPGYLFDKTTGALEIVDPATGQSMTYATGEQALNAATVYKSFDDYAGQIGSGVIVEGSSYHKGFEIDIDGKIGDPIFSFTDGTVLKAQTEAQSGGYGNSIIVQMSDGSTVRYAHLNNLPLKEGQQVYAGMVLGEMGNTGNVIPMGGGDGSHLHIEAKDADGNLIPLDDLNVNEILPTGFNTSSDSALYAIAASKGYIGADEAATYINALKNGIELPDITGQEETEEKFDQVVKLQSQYKDLSKEVRTLEEGFAYAKTFDIYTDNAYDDDSLIFSYVKVLDPGSVVREGEYDIRKNATTLYNQIANKFDLAIKGEGMFGPEQRQKIIDTMNSIYESKRKLYDSELEDAVKVGEAFDIAPDLYLSYMPGDWMTSEMIETETTTGLDAILGF
jgi:murein DD-endopeptidase MepM/ murein hydrolase activator NlpD